MWVGYSRGVTNPFDNTSEDLYDVEALVHFLPTSDGGLKNGLQSGAWAHFHFNNENWHVWLHFRDAPWVSPGESQAVYLRFQHPLPQRGRIGAGMPFVLKYAHAPFAYGSVMAILNLENNAQQQLGSLEDNGNSNSHA